MSRWEDAQKFLLPIIDVQKTVDVSVVDIVSSDSLQGSDNCTAKEDGSSIDATKLLSSF